MKLEPIDDHEAAASNGDEAPAAAPNPLIAAANPLEAAAAAAANPLLLQALQEACSKGETFANPLLPCPPQPFQLKPTRYSDLPGTTGCPTFLVQYSSSCMKNSCTYIT